jgi:hypothetical protein
VYAKIFGRIENSHPWLHLLTQSLRRQAMRAIAVAAGPVLLLLALSSCDGVRGRTLVNPPAEFDHRDIGYQALAKHVVSAEEYLGLPTQVITVGPYLVVSDRASDQTLHLLHAESGRHVLSLGRRGGGPGEFMNAPELMETPAQGDTSFWAYDVALGRLTRYDLAGPEPASLLPDTVFGLALDRVLYQLAFVGDREAFALGLFDGGRYADLDLATRRFTLRGTLPPNPKLLDPAIVQQAYKANLVVRPGGDRAVVGAIRGSTLEFYGRGGDRLAVVNGPYRFGPDFVMEAGRFVAGWKNRYGYIDLGGTEDRLYGLFSGRSEEAFRNDSWFAEYVHEFDWNGAFLRALRLDTPVFDIAVDRARGAMYAVATDPEPAILRYDIPPPDSRARAKAGASLAAGVAQSRP